MTDTTDRLLTVAGAAKFLTLAQQTVRNFTCKGRIPVIKIGRRCVYDRDALLKWALAQTTAPAKRSAAKKRRGAAA
jgi:excisionase family DNA binding protein